MLSLIYPSARLLSPLSPWAGPIAALPAIELHETPEALLVTVQLPGISARDVQVQVGPRSLTLWGEQRQYSNYPYARAYRQFHHTIPLPVTVRDRQAQVAFQQDQVVLTLPKASWNNRFSGINHTFAEEAKYQRQKLEASWRQGKRWLGRQLRNWGDALLGEGR